jgi:hypothetical protein
MSWRNWGADQADDRDPFVVAQDLKYGWATDDETWIELADFKCWACPHIFKFEGKPVQLFKSMFYSLICPNCGVRNYTINPEEQNEEQDLKKIQDIF